jgi:two-component system nitrogen regulation response regulator GlnG
MNENSGKTEDMRVFEKALKSMEHEFCGPKKRDLYRIVLSAVERPLIEMVLERTFGNQIRAAKILGINRNTLRSKIKKLNIDVDALKNL